MPKKSFISPKEQVWIRARKQFRLSHAHIQMARELGLDPGGFGKIANHRLERGNVPLPEFIADLYGKRFGKTTPDNVQSIEQIAQDKQAKNAAKKSNMLRAVSPIFPADNPASNGAAE